MLASHELFGFVSPGLANEILEFARESDKPTYKTVVAAVAQARHLRPVFLERQERAARHATKRTTAGQVTVPPTGSRLRGNSGQSLTMRCDLS